MSVQLHQILSLLVAAGIGLLIGIERERRKGEGLTPYFRLRARTDSSIEQATEDAAMLDAVVELRLTIPMSAKGEPRLR